MIARELSKELSVSFRTVQRYLSHLKEEGRIQRVGSNKTGTWQVKSN